MTPPDEKDGPDYKPTAQIEKPPAWAISIMERMNTGFASLERRLDLVESNVDITGSTVRELSSRVTRVEDWRLAVDDRINRHSGGTRQLSQNDGKQDAAIANAITRLERVETAVSSIETKTDRQTAILERLNDVAANPMVRRVAYAVGGAVLAYLTARGWLPK